MYCGQFILCATMTVSWLAIPARKTSALVVVWFLDFLPATHILIFKWLMAHSTMVLILYREIHSLESLWMPGNMRKSKFS